MENLELVLMAPRSRRMPEQMYMASVAVLGTEGTASPQIVVYSSNVAFLKTLVAHHNEVVRSKKAKK